MSKLGKLVFDLSSPILIRSLCFDVSPIFRPPLALALMRTTSISAWEIKQHLKAVANLEGFNILFQACVSCCMEAGQSLWWDVEDKSIQGSAVVTPLSFLQRPDINSAATIICPPTQKPIISISGKKHPNVLSAVISAYK